MLLPYLTPGVVEAGCDEAGRGCLAGPVYAAAVILPPLIEEAAVAWAVGVVDNQEIDKINILRASILAMHRAIDALKVRPEALLIDGNRFSPYHNVPHTTIVKGDGKMMSIAAASVLAKTYRDDFMTKINAEYPAYRWRVNKGYPTADHRAAIAAHGTTPYHRLTFRLLPEAEQLTLF
jgi:ribonuclease HII